MMLSISERLLLLSPEALHFYRLRLYFHNLLDLPLDTLFLSDIIKALDNNETLYSLVMSDTSYRYIDDNSFNEYSKHKMVLNNIENFVFLLQFVETRARAYFMGIKIENNLPFYAITNSLVSKNKFTTKHFDILEQLRLDNGMFLSDFKDI